MSWVNAGQTGAFKVDVVTTDGAGHAPEFWAKRCVERLISVADSAPPELREQALAYQNRMEQVILLHMKRAIQSDRTTVSHAVTEAGQPGLADLLRRL